MNLADHFQPIKGMSWAVEKEGITLTFAVVELKKEHRMNGRFARYRHQVTVNGRHRTDLDAYFKELGRFDICLHTKKDAEKYLSYVLSYFDDLALARGKKEHADRYAKAVEHFRERWGIELS